MSDYDNTNKGAAFKPFPEMAMILQGRVDNNGNNEELVLVKPHQKMARRVLTYTKRLVHYSRTIRATTRTSQTILALTKTTYA